MRTRWWVCIVVGMGVLTCAAAYRHFTQPTGSPEAAAHSDRQAVEQKPERSPADQGTAPVQHAADAGSEPDHAAAGTGEQAEPNDTKQDLSYLAYYAYSEIPPEPKPADIVLNSLKDTPPGTPVDEIKLVSDLLGFDFTFMKTVAKIESGLNPQQRTGSYIGLFQLSKHEFATYGSGDILVPRDNTVAAALKFMTEDLLFEIFTHRKPNSDDLYLIHQQGLYGAAEHVSHPRRLAWRSMCATDEGREKGERWCKLAIWGNTLPAVKRIWKNVNNVTSADFIAMWQQRISLIYARYSEPAAMSTASTPKADLGSQASAKTK